MNIEDLNEAEAQHENSQTPSEEPQKRQPFYLKPYFWALLALFFGAFLLRLALSNVIQGHPTDIINFKAWSMHAARHPFSEFYKSVNAEKGVWADYPPLYILVLWAMGKFYMLFDPSFSHWSGPFFTILMKLPSIMADLGCMAFIILILKRYISFTVACFAAFVFALHPAVFYESAMWGQIDSITFFLQLLATWLLIKEDYAAAILVTTLNILVKPQGLILMPFILCLTVYRKQYLHLLTGIGASFLVTFVLTALFVPFSKIIPWLWSQYVSQANLYPHSSIQAFNLWSLSGFWKSDVSRGIFGIGGGAPALIWQHKTWGLILFSFFYALALFYFWQQARKVQQDENGNKDLGILIWHASTLIMVAFFLFPTRMHERYLYSGLFFLLGSAFLQRKLLLPFGLYSLTFCLNLLYELPGDKRQLKFPELIYQVNAFFAGYPDAGHHPHAFEWYKVVAIFNLVLFAGLLYLLFSQPMLEYSVRLQQWMADFGAILKAQNKPLKGLKTTDWIPAPMALDRLDLRWMGGILFGTAILKLWRLGFPPEMVFDEVYHARAAGEYIIAVKPLEWVHPPLAKLLIAVGVLFYNLTGVGWRVMPVIAGTLLLASVYCLARFLLPHRWQAVAATLMLSCDGVYFVQSRMAMTNIFATFFQVTALMFAWRFIQYYWHRPQDKRNYVYFSAAVIFISLALSTRWTSLFSYGFMIGLLGVLVLLPSTISLSQKQDQNVDMSTDGKRIFSLGSIQFSWALTPRKAWLWVFFPLLLIVVPFAVYMTAYAPFYLNYGYDFMKVLEEQRNMWNYHAHLTAPHPYYSAWYTWPWLVRPTWYYFQNYHNGTLGGIFAVGNPAIWWFSMPAVGITLVLAWLQKRMALFFMGLACLFMYLPWGISPRHLNYAHYFFEAVPYACLSITAIMAFLIQAFRKTGMKISVAYFSLVCFLFLMFYPIYSALPIPWSYYNLLRWFPSWV